MNMPIVKAKTGVAKRFGRAAAQYDEHAMLQKQVAQRLYAWANVYPSGEGRALDIGCGTGQLGHLHRQHFAKWLNVDIAVDMVKQSRKRADSTLTMHREQNPASRVHYLCADAEALPLKNQSIDHIFSSMALQWCHSLPCVLSEIYRVLAPNGKATLAILISPSFCQLTQAWYDIALPSRLNTFASFDDWRFAAQAFDWTVSAHQESFYTQHSHVIAALKSIKAVGANSKTVTSAQDGISKEELRKLQTCFAQQKYISLDYQVCFLALQKHSQRTNNTLKMAQI